MFKKLLRFTFILILISLFIVLIIQGNKNISIYNKVKRINNEIKQMEKENSDLEAFLTDLNQKYKEKAEENKEQIEKLNLWKKRNQDLQKYFSQ